MSVQKKILFSFILMTVFFVALELMAAAVLLVIEEDTRSVDRKYLHHPLRDHAYMPDSLIRDDWPDLKTDRYGYIVTPGAPQNPELTIVLIGSSGARSQQPYTGADKTLAALIQNKLNEEYQINAEVKNLAVAGYYAFYEFMSAYEYLEQHGLEADMIISASGLYSIGHFSQGLKGNLKKGRVYDLYNVEANEYLNDIYRGRFQAALKSVAHVFLRLDLNISTLAAHVLGQMETQGRRKKDKQHAAEAAIDFENDQAVKAFYKDFSRRERMNYEMVDTLAKAHEAQFALFLLPAKYSWANMPLAEEKDIFEQNRWFLNRFYGEFLSSQGGHPVHDLSAVFDGIESSRNPFNDKDKGHYNDVGTEVLAGEITRRILPTLKRIKLEKAAR